MRFFLMALPFALTSPVFAQDAAPQDAEAIAAFSASYTTSCASAFDEDRSLVTPPQRFDLQSPSSWGEPSAVVLWQFSCQDFAYNSRQVFLIWTQFDGIMPVALAQPVVKPSYQDPENTESPLESLEIIGWSASTFAMNAGFDPESLQLTSYSLWRGVGDASESGTWQLRDEAFQLISYDVDASYDGESNPEQLVDLR